VSAKCDLRHATEVAQSKDLGSITSQHSPFCKPANQNLRRTRSLKVHKPKVQKPTSSNNLTSSNVKRRTSTHGHSQPAKTKKKQEGE
jgi:hypothetical protein